MPKQLSEMTNEELWQLFPIIVREHDENWRNRFLEEEMALRRAIGQENIVRLRHIGSTAVPGLAAKPTIDILIELADDADIGQLALAMANAGYQESQQPDKPPPHLMFMKGYTIRGFEGQVFHVHMRYAGDWDEVHFRDYLCRHPEAAREYEHLKRELAVQYRHDRDGYTGAKGDFVKRITGLARREAGEP